MISAKINAFLSCSFSKDDRDLNDLIKNVCLGLDIECQNVSEGYSRTPSDQARELIKNAPLLIAVITKRMETSKGDKIMPEAVRDEISMAFGLEKQLLLIVEEGIKVDDFTKGYATYLNFKKETMYDHDFIRKLISSIHRIKLEVASDNDLLLSHCTKNYHAESVDALFELVHDKSSGFTWEYTICKKLVFNDKMTEPIKIGAWSTQDVILPDKAEPIHFEILSTSGSKDFNFNLEIYQQDPSKFQGQITIEPTPEKGDIVCYETLLRSPYLNPTHIEDIRKKAPITIYDKKLLCYDGNVPIQMTKNLKVQFRFPREYNVPIDQIHPFVASYTYDVDYAVESEIKRIEFKFDKFGGHKVMTMSIQSPLIGHIYGVAWNPPSKNPQSYINSLESSS